jgi:hypothetical protein
MSSKNKGFCSFLIRETQRRSGAIDPMNPQPAYPPAKTFPRHSLFVCILSLLPLASSCFKWTNLPFLSFPKTKADAQKQLRFFLFL